jgi:NADH-quinone oxidoreductase subunit H
MKWLRALAPVAVALVFAWLVSGRASCGKPPALQLIQVLDVAPHDVEPGDRMAILGAGFPAGKPARVTFRGTLNRPGESPQANAEVAVWGVAVGPEQVEIAFDEPTEALFCGAADRATHTTFEGEMEVAFSAAVAASPPIAGVLTGVTLDVHPSALTGVDRDGEGDRVLAFLGLHAAAAGGGVGLRVEGVEPASRAQAAGIVPGDVLATFDGVRVGSAGDVVPFAGEREATVGVRRAGSTNAFVRTVSVDGLRRAPPAELLGSALLIVAALAFVLVFYAPTPSGLATRVAQAASRTRSRLVAGAGRPTSPGALSEALSFVAREVVPPLGARALVDASAYAVLAVMPLGQYVVAARLDVGILFLAVAVSLAGAALVTGRSTARQSAWEAVIGASQIAWQHVPAAVAVASVVLMTGSLRLQEIERAQGPWPWDWLAFRSPAALVSLVLLLSAGRLGSMPTGRPSRLAALLFDPAAPLEDAGGPYVRAVWRVHRIIMAGLATVLFLGGWALPGLSPAQQDARPGLELLGDLWFLAKTVALVLFLAWSRWALPVASRGAGARLSAMGVALGAAALGTTVAWTRWSPPRAEQLLISGSLVAVVALVVLAVAQRLRYGLTAPDSDRRLSPFL